MKIAGLDTGETNGFVIVNDAGTVICNFATNRLLDVYAKLGQYRCDDLVVVLERAAPNQPEYIQALDALLEYGYTVHLVSPGDWKPNPQCKTLMRGHKGWTRHECDALSLIKYYRLLRAAATKSTKKRKGK